MKIYIIIFLFIQTSLGAITDYPFEFKNAVYDEYIKSVSLEVNNLPTNFPVLALNSSSYVMLKFDDLLNEERSFYYKIIHCDKDWKPSRLSEIEYIIGYNDERMRNYSYSVNTKTQYLHHWQQIPNKDTKLKVSGNYLLIVYEDKIDYPMLTRRFIVSENKVQVNINAIYPGDVENIRFKQEMQVNINFEKFKMRNPLEEISLLMLQNDNWYVAEESKPSFFSGTILKFNKLKTFDFWGLNEFRQFDTRTLFRLGRGVDFIERNLKSVDVLLMLDEPRRDKVYLNTFDFNGRFVIDNFERLNNNTITQALDAVVSNIKNDKDLRQTQKDSFVNSIITRDPLLDNEYKAEERNIRSDYTNVTFVLKDDLYLKDESIYVFGAMNNWLPNEDYLMKYDDSRGVYSTTVPLKQGFYNYYYGLVDPKDNFDFKTMEGSWSDTENDYQTIVYYRGLGDIYDRIIGFETFNTSASRLIR
ncbi:MAG: DUF5103 domain-containing protein [Saprospiraceae bacterium]|nr:DUF5103 domain-containing protein [Saprospiraceae bacterium]